MHGEGISTPHVHHKGRQPLIKCANSGGVCVHQMNKYLPHAYILKRTKSNTELIHTRT